jgi:membrane protein required for colicin V production
MTALDAVVVAITLLFLIRGVWVGFVRQLASIAALLLGFIFAGIHYEALSPRLDPFIASPQLRFLLTYALIFLAVFLAVVLLGLVLRKVMTISLLDWFDRLLGGIFGLGKAALVSTVCFMGLAGVLAASNPLLTGSFFAPHLTKSSAFLLGFLKDQELQRLLLPQEPAISLPLLAVPAEKTAWADPKKIRQ